MRLVPNHRLVLSSPRTRRESGKLSQDSNKLHILLREAEAQRDKLTEQDFQRKKELKEAAKEVERARQQVGRAH